MRKKKFQAEISRIRKVSVDYLTSQTICKGSNIKKLNDKKDREGSNRFGMDEIHRSKILKFLNYLI